MNSTPLFVLDLEIDEFQTEKISIFSEKEINIKLSHFFKNYSINNPEFKKKIFHRVSRFFDHIKTRNLFNRPMNESPDAGFLTRPAPIEHGFSQKNSIAFSTGKTKTNSPRLGQNSTGEQFRVQTAFVGRK